MCIYLSFTHLLALFFQSFVHFTFVSIKSEGMGRKTLMLYRQVVSFSALSVGLSGIAHTCKQLLQITSEVIIITSLHQLQACRNVMSVIRHKLGVPQSNRSITHLTYLVCIYDMSVCGWTKVYFLNTALISCKFL